MPNAIVIVGTEEHAAQLEQMLETWLTARHPAHGRIDVTVIQDPLIYIAQAGESPYLFDSKQARDTFLLLQDWANPDTGQEALLGMDFVEEQAATILEGSSVGELLFERGVSFQDMPASVAISTAEWWVSPEIRALDQPNLDAALDAKAQELIDAGYDVSRTEARRLRRLEVVRDEARRRLELFESGDPATGRHWVNAVVRDAFGAVRGQARQEDERPGWIGALVMDDPVVKATARAAVEEAVADPDFAVKLDWARRYKDTNPEAARYLAQYQEEI